VRIFGFLWGARRGGATVGRACLATGGCLEDPIGVIMVPDTPRGEVICRKSRFEQKSDLECKGGLIEMHGLIAKSSRRLSKMNLVQTKRYLS
jgi:hypothetical protein